MHKIIKSLAITSIISTARAKRRISHLCIRFFGGLLYFLLKLLRHSIYCVTEETKSLIFISKESMKNMSQPKINRTSLDQSDWQDEGRNSGRQSKLPFMKPDVSSPTLWVNPFNSTLSPVATLIKLSFPYSFPD